MFDGPSAHPARLGISLLSFFSGAAPEKNDNSLTALERPPALPG